MKIKENKIYNLTAKEAIEMLLSNEMANYITNIQLTKPSNGGNHHKRRRHGSKNKMTLDKLAVIVQNGFKQVNARIDNLVSKNNLKE